MSEIPHKHDSGEESVKRSLKGDAARRAVRPELNGPKAAPVDDRSNDKRSIRETETAERPKATTAGDAARRAVRPNLDGPKAAPGADRSNDKRSLRKTETAEKPKAISAGDAARRAVRTNLNATAQARASNESHATDRWKSSDPSVRAALNREAAHRILGALAEAGKQHKRQVMWYPTGGEVSIGGGVRLVVNDGSTNSPTRKHKKGGESG